MGNVIVAASTIYKGSDDLQALFFACDPRATRGSGSPCCGCALARTPEISHFPGQSRLFSLFGLRIGAAPGLEKSTTYAMRLIGKHRLADWVGTLLDREELVMAMAQGSKLVKWLDVPGGPVASGQAVFVTGHLGRSGAGRRPDGD